MRKNHKMNRLQNLCRPGQLISLLLALALLLPAAQPRPALAQDGSSAAVDSDIARYTTFAQVQSTVVDRSSNNVEVAWTTAYETANAGFNIVVNTENGFATANEELILSIVGNSLEAQDYAATVSFSASEFYLEFVTVNGESHRTGPYQVGENYGAVAQKEEVDWAAIRAASEEMDREREVARIAEMNAALDAVRGPAPGPDEPLVEQSAGVLGERSLFLPLITGGETNAQAEAAGVTEVVPGVSVNLIVKEDGIYRVEFNDIHQDGNGVDLEGVPAAYLALSNQGEPVRIRMVAPAGGAWGDGAYFEFIGESLKTIYTDENVYVLEVDRSKAFRTYRNLREPDLSAAAADYYMQTDVFEQDLSYAQAASGDDPWNWMGQIARPDRPSSKTISAGGIDQVAVGMAPAKLIADIWGGSTARHHSIFAVNGTQVADVSDFVGYTARTVEAEFSSSVLVNGSNSFVWSMPGDTVSGSAYDSTYLDKFAFVYPRYFAARNEQLTFDGTAERFEVSGVNSDAAVYSIYRNRVWRMEHITAHQTSTGPGITFRGWGDDARYVVVAPSKIQKPTVEAGQNLITDIKSGLADFVIIAHPDFIGVSNGLEQFAATRAGEGYKVKVVNVMDIYAQFSGAIFDAKAIAEYIAHAYTNMGTRYFLLVGGDTIDPTNIRYAGVSYIPSLYAKTYNNPAIIYAPVDPLYTDVTGPSNQPDGIPDAAIGRWPVRTPAELQAIVAKTLNYTPYGKTAMFAADDTDYGGNYATYSNGFIATLGSGWTIETAYLDDALASATDAITFDTIQNRLFDALNGDRTLISYLGHSSFDRWSFDTRSLLTTTDLAEGSGTTGKGKTGAILQWGCWSGNYTIPTTRSITEALILPTNRSAVVSGGATGLTSVTSDIRLAEQYTSAVTQTGVTVGGALQAAKLAMIAGDPATNRSAYRSPDVVIGWTLMGDPTLKLFP